MGLFKSSEKFEKVLGGFFNQVSDTPSVADKLLASKLIIRFTYTDPDVVIVVDCSGDKVDVRPGDTETKAEVEMSMSADIAHKFWFGKVNLMAALTRRQMVAKGPIPKILKLLPAIKPTYTMYPKYLEDNGYSEYNIY
jgi:putative sterol carrier protein